MEGLLVLCVAMATGDDDNTSLTKLNRTHQLWQNVQLFQSLKATFRDQFDLFVEAEVSRRIAQLGQMLTKV